MRDKSRLAASQVTVVRSRSSLFIKQDSSTFPLQAVSKVLMISPGFMHARRQGHAYRRALTEVE